MYIHALECKQCKQCLQCGADSVCNQDFRKCFSIANTVCKYSCVHIDSTLDAVDPVHSRNCTVCSICAAVPTACRPGGPRAIAMGGRAALVPRACGGIRRQGHGVHAGCALGGLQAKRAWSRAGATTEQPRSDHGATNGASAERHGAARGASTELLRTPSNGAAHGASTELLCEAACTLSICRPTCELAIVSWPAGLRRQSVVPRRRPHPR